jgi:CubicO group peptidase (beta-lactamase class C family)
MTDSMSARISTLLIALATVLASHGAVLAVPPTSGDDDTLSVRAAAAKHATDRFDTWEQLVHTWRMLGNTGMRLKDIEVFEDAGGERTYAGVWEPSTAKHALYRYDSWSAFVNKWEDLNDTGYRLIDIERVRHGNVIWYYGVWRAGGGGYALYAYDTWKEFTDRWSDLNGQGLRLIDIDISQSGGVTSYLGVWREGSGKTALYNFNSWSALADKWSELGSQGYQLIDMDVTRLEDGTTRYVGVWGAANAKRALYAYTTWTAFKRKWAELAEQGYSMLDVEVVQRNETGRLYVGSFGPAPSAPAGGPDLRVMAQYLEDTLGEDSVVGMSYALSQHGQLAIAGSTGSAQRAPDTDVPMTSEIRSTIASVSKAVTAPLVYKLLADNGLTLDSAVTPFLPAAWAKGPGFNSNSVTFRHLLTHTSGLAQAFDDLKADGQEGPWGNDWDGLEFVVGNGTVAPNTRSYKNANFALLRVIIPQLWKMAGGPGGAITEANVGERYLDYLHALVLNREQIESIACWPQAGYPEAKTYNFDDPGLAGASNSSSPDGCGGHANLHFSAQELTQYAAAFRYDDGIMSPADRVAMRNERAGWDGSTGVEGGTAYWHGGSWNKTGGRRTRTCMMELPNGVNASIIINSLPPVDKCGVLRDAFNAAVPD